MANEQKSGNVQSNTQQHRADDDFAKVGPTSIEGVEASDLPDKGRGDVFTDPSKEAGRRLPSQTGQWGEGDTGLRGDPDIADADEHGHGKHT
ncbi:MAG TPA: hypothetical protein VGI81_23005 [Tepidisphaeraceae bacterium]|jgi:hypothetical protein